MHRRQTTPPHLAVIKPRAQTALAVIVLLYGLLAGRLIYLQVVRHAYFQREAEKMRVIKRPLLAERGQILDRNGDLLAMNEAAWAVYADPKEVQDPADAASKLAPLLGLDPALLEAKLRPARPTRYVALARHVNTSVKDQIAALHLLGIGATYDAKRVYPNGPLAAQVLGFTNADGAGIEGIERSAESLLVGKNGLEVAEVDRKGRFLPGTERQRAAVANGRDLVLTVDANLQHIADEALAKGVQDHGAKKGVVVVLDPQTGEILALSNQPGYDPNSPRPSGPLTKDEALAAAARWRNGAISDLYEPGSTLKTITAAAILQEHGLGMLNVPVYCPPTLKIGKHTIHEAPDALTNNLGMQDLRGILRVSSNVGMAQFGLRLGARPLYEYEQKFGFLDPPGSGLPGEARSHLQSPESFNRFTGSVGWSKIQLANISFGQGVSVTPLQVAAAYGAIANGGTLMRPHIVRAVRQGDRETPVAPETVRRVLSPEVSDAMRSLLGTVVETGTGQPAQIAGYTVGGKTGSAQVAGRHGYEGGHYVASFVGLYPLSKPRLVILCAVYEPQGIHWGAAVAAPVVHDIAKRAMLALHVPPDSPDTPDWADRKKKKRG